jgi:hypothetical protein
MNVAVFVNTHAAAFPPRATKYRNYPLSYSTSADRGQKLRQSQPIGPENTRTLMVITLGAASTSPWFAG